MKKIALFALLLLLPFTLTAGQDPLVETKNDIFVMGMIRPDTQLFGKWQRLVYDEVFKRLGVSVTYRYLPARRATEYILDGKIDGEPARPRNYINQYPDLIKVQESVFMVNFTAFTANRTVPALDGWDSLKQKDFRVEHRRGIHICEKNLPPLVKGGYLSSVPSSLQGLKKLRANRTDIFIDEETGVLTELQTNTFKGSSIRAVGVMASFPTYMYINKKYAGLEPILSSVIKSMKEEGVIRRYRKQLNTEFGVVSLPATQAPARD